MLAIHNSIPVSRLSSPPHLEVVTVELQYKVPLILCLVYIPPQTSTNYYSDLFDFFINLLSPCNKLILLGDFNFPDIDWDSLSGHHPHSNIFCDIVYRFNLLQYVEQPTHKMGNTLDLVLSNDTDLVNDLSIDSSQNHSPLSDNFKISFKVPTASPPRPNNTQSRYAMNYSKADWMGLTSYLLDYDFSYFYSTNDLDTLWSLLYYWTPLSSLFPSLKSKTLKIQNGLILKSGTN